VEAAVFVAANVATVAAESVLALKYDVEEQEKQSRNGAEADATDAATAEFSEVVAATANLKEVFEAMEEAEENNRNPLRKELCRKMQDVVASAVPEYDALSAQVINHIKQKMKELNITHNNDAAWNEMFLAAQSKSEKAKSVE
jgi:hypothetical protein